MFVLPRSFAECTATHLPEEGSKAPCENKLLQTAVQRKAMNVMNRHSILISLVGEIYLVHMITRQRSFLLSLHEKSCIINHPHIFSKVNEFF